MGAYLTGLWGLPDPIVEGLAFNQGPDQSAGQGFSPLVAVHAANAIEQKNGPSDIQVRASINQEYLASRNLPTRLPVWMAACRAAGNG